MTISVANECEKYKDYFKVLQSYIFTYLQKYVLVAIADYQYDYIF